MAWAWTGTEQSEAVANVQTTELFSSAIALGPGETAQVDVGLSWGTSTGYMTIRVYRTTADSPGASDWAMVGEFAYLASADWDGKRFAIPALGRGLFKIRLGFVRTLSDGDGCDVTVYHRKDGGPS